MFRGHNRKLNLQSKKEKQFKRMTQASKKTEQVWDNKNMTKTPFN